MSSNDRSGSPLETERRRTVFSELCAGQWNFHGWGPSVYQNHRASTQVLNVIMERVSNGSRTIETGCGYSTIAFALTGSRHTVVSPSPWEHDRVRVWCSERGVPTDAIDFVSLRSEDYLPSVEEEFDFALVDGDHAFPVPFVDFFYIARKMREGSTLVVDDTDIRTGSILREFLDLERTRWRRIAEHPTSVVFERLAGDLIDPAGWSSQPFCSQSIQDRFALYRARAGRLARWTSTYSRARVARLRSLSRITRRL